MRRSGALWDALALKKLSFLKENLMHEALWSALALKTGIVEREYNA